MVKPDVMMSMTRVRPAAALAMICGRVFWPRGSCCVCFGIGGAVPGWQVAAGVKQV